MEYQDHGTLAGILYMLAYISILFVCVVLHEYGHAMMAKYYGIKTRDIILSPIGGIARLEEIPEVPKKELYIAIAGPAVNLVIAGVIGLVLVITQQSFLPEIASITDLYNLKGLTLLVFWMNIVLFVFNLMPALPMDGGRILRALLSMRMDRLRATRIAMYIGKVIAIGLFAYAVYNFEFVLAFIGVFVFYSADAEYQNLMLKRRLQTTEAQSMMKTQFSKVSLDMDYADLITIFQQTGENNFLIFDSDYQPIGNIPYQYLADYVKHKRPTSVSNLYQRSVTNVKAETALVDLFDLMQEQGIGIVAVTDAHGAVIGVIDRHLLQDWMAASSGRGSFLSRLFS